MEMLGGAEQKRTFGHNPSLVVRFHVLCKSDGAVMDMELVFIGWLLIPGENRKWKTKTLIYRGLSYSSHDYIIYSKSDREQFLLFFPPNTCKFSC